ncbi:MAG: hypothetical protein NUV80_03140 [Candidatus Berkelbacteria bacterium]|nr:hypothetical protein [Candidatus Berkelbacteria bacterium]
MAEIIEAKHAEQAGHWYDDKGRPAYTIIGKNGKERNTTLRDARALNLVPSVTSIIRLAAAQGLENWKQEQTILACLTLPIIHNENEQETEAEYIARIKQDAKAQSQKAAQKGTEIHAKVQGGFEGKEGSSYYASTKKCLDEALQPQVWIPERSFACDGYGGKVDLSCEGFVVDLKSTDKDLATIKTWDEHTLQLSAYRHGLGMDAARCFILYVHIKTAESKLIEIEPELLEKGWKMFAALLQYFYAKTGLNKPLTAPII